MNLPILRLFLLVSWASLRCGSSVWLGDGNCFTRQIFSMMGGWFGFCNKLLHGPYCDGFSLKAGTKLFCEHCFKMYHRENG